MPEDGRPEMFANRVQKASYKKIMAPLRELNAEGGMVPCQSDPDLWWSDDRDDQKIAATLCQGCPVIMSCAEWAVSAKERHGVWGGMTIAQRTTLINRNDRHKERKPQYQPDAPYDRKSPEEKQSFGTPETPHPEDPGIPLGIEWDDERHGLAWFYNDGRYACRCEKCRRAKSLQRKYLEERERAGES